MIRLFFLSLFFWAAIPGGHAQYNYIEGDPLDFYRVQKGRENNGRFLATAEIAGTPYLQEEFKFGTVFANGNKRYKDIPLRYNIYNDQIEFKNDQDQVLALSNPEIVNFIELDGQKIVYRPYVNNKRLHYGFFLVLAEGPVNLFLKKTTIVQQAKPAGAYAEAEPAQFVPKPDTYYLQAEGQSAELILGKKELPALFPGKNREVETYIKDHKVNVNKPEDLKALVRYYNGL